MIIVGIDPSETCTGLVKIKFPEREILSVNVLGKGYDDSNSVLLDNAVIALGKKIIEWLREQDADLIGTERHFFGPAWNMAAVARMSWLIGYFSCGCGKDVHNVTTSGARAAFAVAGNAKKEVLHEAVLRRYTLPASIPRPKGKTVKEAEEALLDAIAVAEAVWIMEQ